MGMLQYVSKFIPNLSTESAPLRQLLEKNVIWNWNETHRNCYKRLKELVSSAPVLRFYDVNESVTLSVDASSTGLGAVILQNDQPVAFASKALTETQMRYAQIEKEMLAIVFGCVKFHQYIFGKTITVQTDHKPLESIMKKPLYLAPVRLQKMLMKLQRYDLKVEYMKGTELYVADTLSRAHLPETSDDFDEELEVSIVLAVSDTKMSQIGRETDKDETLKILKSVILEGWPENRSQLHTKVQDFWNYRDELSVYDDIIYKGERIVIPSSMRSEMLDRIHESHLGIEKSRSRARDILFWPRMSQDIEELISKCSVCQEHRNKNQKEPLLPHEVPNRPWSKLGADIFQFGNEQYLLIVDYYSEFFEISKLSDLKSITVITHCKSQFARHGIPDIFMSDNGTQFDSREFRQFADEYGFELKTSSPTYPQSNGMAEKAVQTAKRLLKKAKKDGRDPYLALLDFRNTPRDKHLGSPVQRLMGRRTKTTLPTSETLLKPKLVKNVSSNLKEKRNAEKSFYDRNSRKLPQIREGDDVRIRRGNIWEPGHAVLRLYYYRAYGNIR